MLKETKSNRLRYTLYTLGELLDGMPENQLPHTEKEREWLQTPAVGKEYPNGYPDEDELLQAFRNKKHDL